MFNTVTQITVCLNLFLNSQNYCRVNRNLKKLKEGQVIQHLAYWTSGKIITMTGCT